MKDLLGGLRFELINIQYPEIAVYESICFLDFITSFEMTHRVHVSNGKGIAFSGLSGEPAYILK